MLSHAIAALTASKLSRLLGADRAAPCGRGGEHRWFAEQFASDSHRDSERVTLTIHTCPSC